jgi:hypothetical protein
VGQGRPCRPSGQHVRSHSNSGCARISRANPTLVAGHPTHGYQMLRCPPRLVIASPLRLPLRPDLDDGAGGFLPGDAVGLLGHVEVGSQWNSYLGLALGLDDGILDFSNGLFRPIKIHGLG